MKLFNTIAGVGLFSYLILSYPAKAQRKLESSTASAITTPQYAKKVAQTYCDFLESGIEPNTAIQQAENEVGNSAKKPKPFNKSVYNRTLDKAIADKGFCPEVPNIDKIVLRPRVCKLSPPEIYHLQQTKHIRKK